MVACGILSASIPTQVLCMGGAPDNAVPASNFHVVVRPFLSPNPSLLSPAILPCPPTALPPIAMVVLTQRPLAVQPHMIAAGLYMLTLCLLPPL